MFFNKFSKSFKGFAVRVFFCERWQKVARVDQIVAKLLTCCLSFDGTCSSLRKIILDELSIHSYNHSFIHSLSFTSTKWVQFTQSNPCALFWVVRHYKRNSESKIPLKYFIGNADNWIRLRSETMTTTRPHSATKLAYLWGFTEKRRQLSNALG